MWRLHGVAPERFRGRARHPAPGRAPDRVPLPGLPAPVRRGRPAAVRKHRSSDRGAPEGPPAGHALGLETQRDRLRPTVVRAPLPRGLVHSPDPRWPRRGLLAFPRTERHHPAQGAFRLGQDHLAPWGSCVGDRLPRCAACLQRTPVGRGGHGGARLWRHAGPALSGDALRDSDRGLHQRDRPHRALGGAEPRRRSPGRGRGEHPDRQGRQARGGGAGGAGRSLERARTRPLRLRLWPGDDGRRRAGAAAVAVADPGADRTAGPGPRRLCAGCQTLPSGHGRGGRDGRRARRGATERGPAGARRGARPICPVHPPWPALAGAADPPASGYARARGCAGGVRPCRRWRRAVPDLSHPGGRPAMGRRRPCWRRGLRARGGPRRDHRGVEFKRLALGPHAACGPVAADSPVDAVDRRGRRPAPDGDHRHPPVRSTGRAPGGRAPDRRLRRAGSQPQPAVRWPARHPQAPQRLPSSRGNVRRRITRSS